MKYLMPGVVAQDCTDEEMRAIWNILTQRAIFISYDGLSIQSYFNGMQIPICIDW